MRENFPGWQFEIRSDSKTERIRANPTRIRKTSCYCANHPANDCLACGLDSQFALIRKLNGFARIRSGTGLETGLDIAPKTQNTPNNFFRLRRCDHRIPPTSTSQKPNIFSLRSFSGSPSPRRSPGNSPQNPRTTTNNNSLRGFWGSPTARHPENSPKTKKKHPNYFFRLRRYDPEITLKTKKNNPNIFSLRGSCRSPSARHPDNSLKTQNNPKCFFRLRRYDPEILLKTQKTTPTFFTCGAFEGRLRRGTRKIPPMTRKHPKYFFRLRRYDPEIVAFQVRLRRSPGNFPTTTTKNNSLRGF